MEASSERRTRGWKVQCGTVACVMCSCASLCVAVSLSKCKTAWAIRLHATVCDYVCERDGGGHCLELCVV